MFHYSLADHRNHGPCPVARLGGRPTTIIEVIAAASERQVAGIGQVNTAVIALDEVTRQNAALVEEASAASRNTLDLSQVLMNQVAYFTLQGAPGPQR